MIYYQAKEFNNLIDLNMFLSELPIGCFAELMITDTSSENYRYRTYTVIYFEEEDQDEYESK